jgi:hypothetical protein
MLQTLHTVRRGTHYYCGSGRCGQPIFRSSSIRNRKNGHKPRLFLTPGAAQRVANNLCFFSNGKGEYPKISKVRTVNQVLNHGVL